ncbi:MAG: Ig-like domain-containing protein [Ignavibacteria bacterium]|nr:Ig-like domain-containing protein [Ignavibacteria bacterium]
MAKENLVVADVFRYRLGATRLLIVGSVILTLLGAMSGDARAETVTLIPPGTYNFPDFLSASGTSENWIRYKPETPGSVIVRGGTDVENVQYVILDGLIVDARLDPDFPDRGRGIIFKTSNVKVENTLIIGPNDVHTGYKVTNAVASDCKEFSVPNGIGGTGLAIKSNKNITISNVIVYGFNGAMSVWDGGSAIVENSLFRNNFNGVSFSGRSLIIRNSVMWTTPNHQFSIKSLEAGSVFRLENNILVDSQDTVKAGAAWSGADEVYIIHNTFWIPDNVPCTDYSGLQISKVRDKLVVKDNIIISTSKPWANIRTSQTSILTSDYNLFFHYDNNTERDFKIDSEDEIIDVWYSVTGEDSNSLVNPPVEFVDPPRYVEPLPSSGNQANEWGFKIPQTVAEARSWLTLKAGSPGKNAASDGTDIGIVEGFVGSDPPPPFEDTIPPTISITSPSEGATVNGVIAVRASASDNVGVSEVQFRVDDTVFATDGSTPHTVFWDTLTVPTGTHSLTAVATDSSGNQATSSPVTINVTAGGSPASPLVSNVSAASGTSYEIVENTLQTGELVYVDRGFVYFNVPLSLEGEAYIRTANDDKLSQGSQFLTFDVSESVVVYVAHDDRHQIKPDWLAAFTDTGEDLSTTDTFFSLFRATFPEGSLSLGGNVHPSETEGNSMYFVIITKSEFSIGVPAAPTGLRVLVLP